CTRHHDGGRGEQGTDVESDHGTLYLMMTGSSPVLMTFQKKLGSDSPRNVWLMVPTRGGRSGFSGLLARTLNPAATSAAPRTMPPMMPRLPSTPPMPSPVTSTESPL